jgi:hypothetical protein
MFTLNSKLALILSSERQLDSFNPEEFCVVPLSSSAAISNISSPISLIELFQFDEMMYRIAMASPDRKLLVCAGLKPQQQSVISFMMACHLIMSGSLGFEEACLAFQPLQEQIDRYIGDAAFRDSLRAICCAKCIGWLDFRRAEEEETVKPSYIEMGEYIHYSRYAYIHLPCRREGHLHLSIMPRTYPSLNCIDLRKASRLCTREL